MELLDGLEILRGLKAIRVLRVLNEIETNKIKLLEEERNSGVHECLAMKNVVLVTHDSSFRMPPSPIVLLNGAELEFPAVEFTEVKDAISSSPSAKVHSFLTKGLNLDKEEATLLIGFD